MGIKTVEHGTTIRNRLCKTIILAIRNLMKKREPDPESLDLAAYIVLALENIAESVDSAATAWEKRDYWLKADRFRMEWAWAGKLGQALRVALLADDWGQVALVSAQVGEKLKNIEVPQRHKLGTPWVGAWERLTAKK